jgi:uncharacterized secreted protein with C-terminal beta-propeller domain
MDRRTNRKAPLRVAAVSLALMMVPVTSDAASKGHRLRRASSCDAVRHQLLDMVERIVSQQHRYRHHFRLRRKGRPSMPFRSRAESAPRALADSAKSAGPGHHTGTNNQVVGVDEADRVKTDGRFVYTVHGQEVLIINSWPASATRIVARYRLPSGSPQQLFVNGDKLLIFSRSYARVTVRGKARRRIYRPAFSATRATLLDIQDRTSPRLIAHVDIEGSLLQARMIGADIYMVTNNQVQLPTSFWNEVHRPVQTRRRPYITYYGGYSYAPSSQTSLRGRIRRALARVDLQQSLPGLVLTQGGRSSRRPLLRCSDLYFPGGQETSLGLITLSHLSLHGGVVSASAVVGSGMKVYASHSAAYIASHNGRWRNQSGTRIHKFDLNRRQGPPRYAASGVVPGYLLNQFSMDEHRGYLRVATTDSGWSGTWRWRGRRVTAPASNLFVLEQRQGELAIVGQVRGLAPGERIYAARMVGDQGYLVTFRRTDPLYTIDLGNPRRPSVKGELKIPGFSSYIHPIGQGLLLTVGQDADESGRVRGAHLQIFDVSDLESPRRTHHYRLTLGHGSSQSAAQWDHHAFTFNARTRTLALPLTVNNYTKQGGRFTGVILVKVDRRRGFINLGDVEHSDLAASAGPAIGHRHTPIQRSIFIDDNLYTLSSHGLKVSSLPRLETVASVLFARPAPHAFLR